MKPGSVTALKQLQEKLALWSTWDETKKEWESAVLEWCRGTDTLKTKKNLDVGIIYANRRECDRDNTYASLVPRIIDWYAPEEGPEREEFIDSLKEMRRLGEALQSLERNTWCSQFKSWSDVLSGILADSDPNDETP